MNLFYKKCSLFLLITFCAGASCFAEAQVRILGVGNSFTRNSMRFLPQIIKSDTDISADVAYAYIGGCPLDKHVTLADAHEADPAKGKQYGYNMNGESIGRNLSLKEILLDGEWDYITIQQVSSKSYKIETFYPYAERLIDYIRQYAPDAEIVIHETWAHSIDSHRVKAWDLLPDDMYAKLHAAYGQIGEEFGLRIVPVGTAYQNAKKHPLWDYQASNFDPKSVTYPKDKDNLPDASKSLHSVFHWKKNKDGEMYVGNDGFHANQNGEYLGGLVWYEFFFGQDAREVSYKPERITEEQAVSLREAAHETVQALEPETAEPAKAVAASAAGF